MNKSILYMGDTALDRQASYLAGIMTKYEMSFDYIPSDCVFSDKFLDNQYKVMIISDYPSSNFTGIQLDRIASQVKNGMAIFMIGGWESFVGESGNYQDTILAEVLPVVMKSTDDRYNTSNPCIVTKSNKHKIVDSLPLDQNLPTIAGFNELNTKNNAETILSIYEYAANQCIDNISWNLINKFPLFIVGSYGQGKTAVFASDAAPHWSGSFVDWGNTRINTKAEGGDDIEIGNYYAEFFMNTINWLKEDLSAK